MFRWPACQLFFLLSDIVVSGGSKRGEGPPPVKILPPPLWPSPMKFMIKHNLPLVRGGSLWQYRSVPQLQLWPPHCPPNVNPQTAPDCSGPFLQLLFFSVHVCCTLLAVSLLTNPNEIYVRSSKTVRCCGERWQTRAVRISRVRRSGFQTTLPRVVCCVVASLTSSVGDTTVAVVE